MVGMETGVQEIENRGREVLNQLLEVIKVVDEVSDRYVVAGRGDLQYTVYEGRILSVECSMHHRANRSLLLSCNIGITVEDSRGEILLDLLRKVVMI